MSDVTVQLEELEQHIQRVQQVAGTIESLPNAANDLVDDMFGPLVGNMVGPMLDSFAERLTSLLGSATDMLDNCANAVIRVKENYEEAERVAEQTIGQIDTMLEGVPQ